MHNKTIITQIDLLRHGETETKNSLCGSTDSQLSNSGWAQMWNSVEQTRMPWQLIITSPLQRCAHFAHALAKRCAIPVKQEARFKEIDFGMWEGMKISDLVQTNVQALVQFWKDPASNPPPSAEHLSDFRERVLEAWNDILTQHTGDNILLITHGGVIRILQCHIQHYPLERLLELDVPHAALRSIRVRWQGASDPCAYFVE